MTPFNMMQEDCSYITKGRLQSVTPVILNLAITLKESKMYIQQKKVVNAAWLMKVPLKSKNIIWFGLQYQKCRKEKKNILMNLGHPQYSFFTISSSFVHFLGTMRNKDLTNRKDILAEPPDFIKVKVKSS